MTLAPQRPPAEIAIQLSRLVGRWEGTGRGLFPTIEDFRYREVLEFTQRRPAEPTLHYHQQTWLIDTAGRDLEDSHWESGFLLASDSGRLELLNAQESGRVEVLTGELRTEGDGFCIEVSSVVHSHDPRMVATRRTLRLDERSLSYQVDMATSAVGKLQLHLEATLQRTPIDSSRPE